jgi:hypothetical protein
VLILHKHGFFVFNVKDSFNVTEIHEIVIDTANSMVARNRPDEQHL